MRSLSPVDRSGVDCTLYCRPMPSTEVPTSPPGRPPEPFSRRKRVRYEELDPDELLHLIDRLEDERSRALRREGIWISLIAHLLLFWFLIYGPGFAAINLMWSTPTTIRERSDIPEPSARRAKARSSPNLGPAIRQEPRRAIGPPDPRSQDFAAAGGYEESRPSDTGRSAAKLPRNRAPPTPVPPQQAQARPAPPPPPPPQQSLLNEPKPAPTPPPGPASTVGRRTRGMRFARRNGMPPEIPAASLAITGRTRPRNIQPWVLARKFSATPWGSISAPTCGG